jgi:hypothetical protein
MEENENSEEPRVENEQEGIETWRGQNMSSKGRMTKSKSKAIYRPPLWSSEQSYWLQNGDVLCFLRGTNGIYICFVEESTPPLWSSGQSSWLQIQRSGFDYRLYQIFWVVGLERGPLSLVSTIEELLGSKRRGSGLESREYGRGDPLHWQRDTFYLQKLVLTYPTSDGRSVGIVRSRTQATEFSLVLNSSHLRPLSIFLPCCSILPSQWALRAVTGNSLRGTTAQA